LSSRISGQKQAFRSPAIATVAVAAGDPASKGLNAGKSAEENQWDEGRAGNAPGRFSRLSQSGSGGLPLAPPKVKWQ
jgi:hypothetical protein